MTNPIVLETIQTLTPITKKDLLDFYDYNSINQAKKELKLNKATDVYELLKSRYNETITKINTKAIDKFRQKEMKHKLKREKAIREMIKQNQEIQNNIQLKKQERKNRIQKFKVVIDVKQYAKYPNGRVIDWRNAEWRDTFEAVNEEGLEEKISAFLNSLYPYPESPVDVYLKSYSYQIVQEFPNVNMLDVPMKRATPLKVSFLKYFDNINEISYKDYDDMCVIKALQEHLNIKKEKTITDVFREASLKLYNKEWNEKDGVTARMIRHFSQAKHISCLGLDQKTKCFVKHTEATSGKYRPIIFYQVAGHFYIMDKNLTNISQHFKENNVIVSSILKEEEEKKEVQYVNYRDIIKNVINDENAIEEEDVDGYFINGKYYPKFVRDYKYEFETFSNLPNNTIVLFQQGNLNNELVEYVKLYNDCPDVKYESKSNCKSIKLKNGVTLSVTDCIVDNSYVMNICKKENINYKNQTIGTLLNDLMNKYFDTQSGRLRLSKEQRNTIIANQNNMCRECHTKSKSFHIDHIRPLANGGTNEMSNLQALCKTCHIEKSREEKLNCDYHKIRDFISCYNIEAYNTIKSKFFNKIQFSQYLIDDETIEYYKSLGYNMNSIDMNKCRRNLLINYKYDFPVYSCLDNIKLFDGNITCGFYYVECNNVFPLRKNGFYSQPIIEYCIENKIISKFDIIYQYKPSFTIKADYFKNFVECLLKVFEDNADLQKLSINALIGMFGRRENTFIDSAVVDSKNYEDVASIYSTFKAPFLNTLNEDFSVITQSINIDKLENAYPIFAQILDCEALELHNTTKMLKQNGFIPICVKTDAVVYFSKTKKSFDINKQYWDNDKTILKYKDENPQLLKKSIHYVIKDNFKLQSKKYNIIEDDKTFDFNVNVAKTIIDSNKGCFLDGPAGTGKTKLVNEMNKLLSNKNVFRLTPTNVSALLINGETIDKFANRILINSNALHKLQNVDYIFVDEISMVKELFYSIFLSVKYHYPSIKFIISGDFNQLEPVNDRKYFNYEYSRALYELVDGNKLNLTLCRRSDNKLFNICENIKKNKPYDISDFENNDWVSYTNLCYTNAKRKEINNKCMNCFLKEFQPKLTYRVNKLTYDENTQDYTLCVGMPIISRLNRKDLDVFNNEMFKCKTIKSNSIIITNELKELEIDKVEFNKLFNLSFCITIHKSQGISLNKKYAIYEWSKLNKKLKYVALSRATDYNNINIL